MPCQRLSRIRRNIRALERNPKGKGMIIKYYPNRATDVETRKYINSDLQTQLEYD